MLRALPAMTLLALGALSLAALGSGVVLAQNTSVIKQRQDLMKANQETAKVLDAMARGSARFDLAKAKAGFKAFQEHATKLKSLWPEDSKTGGNTHALPAIWTNLKDYLDWFDGFANDAKAAAESVKDEASFKAALPNVFDYCNSCHKDFRARMQ